MEFSTLTKRIAEGLKVEAPPPVERSAASTAAGGSQAGQRTATPPKPGGKAPAPASGATPQAAVVLAANAAKAQKIDRSKYETVTELPQLEAWIAEARAAGRFAFDTETTSLDAMQAEFVGFSMAVAPGKACYVPLGHRVGAGSFDFGDGDLKQVPIREALAAAEAAAGGRLDPQDRAEPQVRLPRAAPARHRRWPRSTTPCCSPTRSTAAAASTAWTRWPSATWGTPASPSRRCWSTRPAPRSPTRRSRQVPLDKATEYAAEDADVTLRLWMVLKPRLAAERMTTVYETLERPLVRGPGRHGARRRQGRQGDPVAAHLHVRPAHRPARGGDLRAGRAQVQPGLAQAARRVPVRQLKLPGGRKTKTGQWETRANLLDDLAAREDLPEQRAQAHQRHAGVAAAGEAAGRPIRIRCPQHINPETGRIHTSYALASTTTGRLASTDPNLQNIPIRTKEGREIRTAFIAERGHKLISADYSQIELRVLAHVADIPQLKKAFEEGLDIHAMTASEMFGVPIEGMPAEVRRRAKAINFGIIYGISAFGLAAQLGISKQEAGEYIATYFKRFPGIRDYMEATKKRGARAGVRGDHFRPARALSRDQYQEPVDARVSGARRHQRADPGLGRRHHPPGHDPHAAAHWQDARLELGAHAAAGARRAGVRGQGSRGR